MINTANTQYVAAVGRGRRRLRIPQAGIVPGPADSQTAFTQATEVALTGTDKCQSVSSSPLNIINQVSSTPPILASATNPSVEARSTQQSLVSQPTLSSKCSVAPPIVIMDSSSLNEVFPLLPSTNPLAVCRYIDSILGLCETLEHRLLYLAIRFRLELISIDDKYQSLFQLESSPFLQQLQEMATPSNQRTAIFLHTKLPDEQTIHTTSTFEIEEYMASHSIQETFDFFFINKDYYNAFLLALSCSNHSWIEKVLFSSVDASPVILRFLNNLLLGQAATVSADIDNWATVLLWLLKLTIRSYKGNWSPEFLSMQGRYLLKLLLHGYIFEAQLSSIALGYILEPGCYTIFIQNNANLLPNLHTNILDIKAIHALPNHMVQTMFINPQQPFQRQQISSLKTPTNSKITCMGRLTQLFLEDIKQKQHVSAEMLLIAELIEYVHMQTYFNRAIKARSRFFPPEPRSIFNSNIHQSLAFFPHLLPYKVYETLSYGYIELALRFAKTLASVILEKPMNSTLIASFYDSFSIPPVAAKALLPPAETPLVRDLADVISSSNSKKDKKGLHSLATLVWSEAKVKSIKIVPTISYSIVLSPLSPLAIHAWTDLIRIGTDIKTRKDALPEHAFVAYKLPRQLSDKILLLGALAGRQSCNISTISETAIIGYDSVSEIPPSCNTSVTSDCSYDCKQQSNSTTLLSNLGKKATAGLGKLFGTLDPEPDCGLEQSRDPVDNENTNSSQFLQQPIQPAIINPFSMPKQTSLDLVAPINASPHYRSSSWLKDVTEPMGAPTSLDISSSDDISSNNKLYQPVPIIGQINNSSLEPHVTAEMDVDFFNIISSSSQCIPAMPQPSESLPREQVASFQANTTSHKQQQGTVSLRRNIARSRVGPMRYPTTSFPLSQ